MSNFLSPCQVRADVGMRWEEICVCASVWHEKQEICVWVDIIQSHDL